MRLFTAIEIDREVMQSVSRLLDELRTRAARLAPDAKITWIPAERLHLTIQFIGHVDAPKSERILQSFQAPLDVPPFSLRVAGVGVFPPRGAPRVVWAGIDGDLDSLRTTVGQVASRLETCGVVPEDREFRPHLTLARVREAAGLRSRELLEDVPVATLGTVNVAAITLFESRLSPRGPTYVALQHTPLLWQS